MRHGRLTGSSEGRESPPVSAPRRRQARGPPPKQLGRPRLLLAGNPSLTSGGRCPNQRGGELPPGGRGGSPLFGICHRTVSPWRPSRRTRTPSTTMRSPIPSRPRRKMRSAAGDKYAADLSTALCRSEDDVGARDGDAGVLPLLRFRVGRAAARSLPPPTEEQFWFCR